MGLIKGLCGLLDSVTNPAIWMLAMLELVLMVLSIATMAGFRSRINHLNSKGLEKSKVSKKEARGKVAKTVAFESKKDWDEFDRFLEEYQRKGGWYSAFSLIIQLFPLLGILGTVAGLYLAMSNGQDMYEGVELALSTTVSGILCAVLFKIADVIIVSLFINYIEDGIDRYEKIYKIDSEEAKTADIPRESRLQ